MTEVIIGIAVVIGAVFLIKAIFPALLALLRTVLALVFMLGGFVLGWMIMTEMINDPAADSP